MTTHIPLFESPHSQHWAKYRSSIICLEDTEQEGLTREFKASNRKVLSSTSLDTKLDCHILIIGDLIL